MFTGRFKNISIINNNIKLSYSVFTPFILTMLLSTIPIDNFDSDDGGVIPMDISEEDSPALIPYTTLNTISSAASEADLLDQINKHIGNKPDMTSDCLSEYEDGVDIAVIDPPEVIQQRKFVKGKRRGRRL